MTTIGTLIVDDEPLARANIASLLRRDAEIEVLGECGSGREAIAMIRELRPSLVFLDVQMPECNGFEVLETLGREAPPAIVFVTAHDQFAVKAFEAEALDYLLKPFSNARFERVLTRVKSALSQHAHGHRVERLMIRNMGRTSFLRVTEVDWVEAADYYARIHAGGKTHMLRRSMADLERDLTPAGFCRIHRSTIVNLDRVRDIVTGHDGEPEVLLHDQTSLSISRSYRETLIERLATRLAHPSQASTAAKHPGSSVPPQ